MSQSNSCKMKRESGDCFRDSCEKLEELKSQAKARILAALGDGGCDFCKAFIDKHKKND